MAEANKGTLSCNISFVDSLLNDKTIILLNRAGNHLILAYSAYGLVDQFKC